MQKNGDARREAGSCGSPLSSFEVSQRRACRSDRGGSISMRYRQFAA